jgi:hypothetical protein
VTPTLWGILIPAIATCLLALASFLRANTAVSKIDNLHTLVNSRLTELVAASSAAARAQGLAQGRAGNGDDPPRNISGVGGKL